MDCVVHGVAKSQTWLSNFHFQSAAVLVAVYRDCRSSAWAPREGDCYTAAQRTVAWYPLPVVKQYGVEMGFTPGPCSCRSPCV